MSTAEPRFDPATEAVIERLREAVRRRYGTTVDIARFQLATLGGSNRTLLFDLVDDRHHRRLVLRQETIAADYTPFLQAPIQWPVLNTVYARGLPVPEPLFELEPVDDLGLGYVVGAIAGETLPKRILGDPAFQVARARFPRQVGTMLARLHRIEPAAVPVLADVPESGDTLEAWMAYYDRWEEPHPVFDFAFRWLALHRPRAPRRCLVHGDFRIGNLIVAPAGLRALLDCECAHIGDPLEDLGWFCTRSWRFGRNHLPAGGLASRDTLYRAYEAAGGEAVDREAARWWEIFGLLRWALYNLMQSYGHMSERRRSPAFAACGRNIATIEYDLIMSIAGRFD